VKNYYDDGTLQSEGQMLNNLPTGVWKYYTPNGQLNQVGEYVQGKRNGRWLKGDLSKTNYLGDICMNPNLPDLEKRIAYQENLLDIEIRYFKLGKIQTSEYYDINMNGKN
jgi:antitoxin component YwqK of YwqJK toxin-antitoxin module